ncbi:hypothetical protein [Chryseobacterium chendengshani]|uniref:hypothetical protein n=1 Tax=Chryseobacterium sp. LJ756 TaxID=2864113 RepID=UPI001C63C834|nr:hypothetical protein [Chryseobacterium sp. LJ756]MBW7675422.1 hypothetical protein [Chryseobacterium sp. LJ756]
MKKKYIILIAIFLFSAAVWFLIFRKDKSLRYIPENADVIVLIDTKKVTRKYITSLLQHPSEWFKKGKSDARRIKFRDSGIKIPDYVQIFHLKNTKITEWYTIFEINDKQEFLAFLKDSKFISNGKDLFKKDQVYIKIVGEKCTVGTSNKVFIDIKNLLLQNVRKQTLNADSFMDGGLGSISLITQPHTQNFSIDLNDDEIEIKSNSNLENFAILISDLKKETQFLEAELDRENIKKFCQLLNINLNDSANINYLKMSADLTEENDTIISYGYDDNFNEIEKVSYQKIIQPAYEIVLQSSNPAITRQHFRNKKWINAQNQFTAIPFQPNSISQNKNRIIIESKRKRIKENAVLKKNYIFVKNHPLLYSSLKPLFGSNINFLKDIEYLFYTSKNKDYYGEIKFVKRDLPLILR